MLVKANVNRFCLALSFYASEDSSLKSVPLKLNILRIIFHGCLLGLPSVIETGY